MIHVSNTYEVVGVYKTTIYDAYAYMIPIRIWYEVTIYDIYIIIYDTHMGIHVIV